MGLARALELLADGFRILIGAHRERGGHAFVTVGRGIRARLFQTKAIARAAAVGTLVGIGAEHAGSARPRLRVVDALDYLEALFTREIEQHVAPVLIFLGRVDVRIHVGDRDVVALFKQEPQRLERARATTRVQKQLQRRHLHHSRSTNSSASAPLYQNLFILPFCIRRRMRYRTRNGPFQRDSRIFHGSLIHHRIFRPRRHAFAHGHRRVHEALFQGARRVCRGKRARLRHMPGRGDGGREGHGEIGRKRHQPRRVLGGVHESDRF